MDKVTRQELSALAQKTGMTESQITERFRKSGVDVESDVGLGSQALDMAGRALDLTGGITRTAIGAGAEALGAGDIYHEGDFFKAMKGKAPETQELLGRGGMEEGSMRSTLGFAGDVLADPALALTGTAKLGGKLLSKLATKLGKKGAAEAIAKAATKTAEFAPTLNIVDNLVSKTAGASKNIPYIGKGVSAVGKVGDAATAAIAKGFDKAGRFVYQGRALQALDDVSSRFGKKKVSDIMYDQGMSGTSASLEKQAQAYNKRLLNERGEILKEIGDAKVSPESIQGRFRKGGEPYLDPLTAEGRNVEQKAAFAEAQRMGSEWFDPLKKQDVMGEVTTVVPSSRDLLPEEIASKGFSPIEFGKKEAKIGEIPQGNLAQLNDIMTSVNQAIGTGAYKGGAINPASTQELKRLAKIAREHMYSVAKSADPIAAQRLEDINKEISALLSTSKKMQSEAGKTASSVVAGPMTGATVMSGNPGLAVGKVSGDVLKSTYFRTKAGLGLKNMSKAASRKDKDWNMVMDAVARQVGQKNLKDEEQ